MHAYLARSALQVALCATAAAVIAPQPAAAQANPADLAEIARGVDMLGTWSVDCSKPPSNANNYLTYRIDEAGRLRHERDFGTDGRDGRDVLDLRALPDGGYEVTVRFGENAAPRVWVNILGRDGRRRTMWNHAQGSTDYSVKDGILSHNGKPTEWLSRCSRTTS